MLHPLLMRFIVHAKPLLLQTHATNTAPNCAMTDCAYYCSISGCGRVPVCGQLGRAHHSLVVTAEPHTGIDTPALLSQNYTTQQPALAAA